MPVQEIAQMVDADAIHLDFTLGRLMEKHLIGGVSTSMYGLRYKIRQSGRDLVIENDLL